MNGARTGKSGTGHVDLLIMHIILPGTGRIV